MKKSVKIILSITITIFIVNLLIVVALLFNNSQSVNDLVGIVAILLLPVSIGFVMFGVLLMATLKTKQFSWRVGLLWGCSIASTLIWLVSLLNSIDVVDASGGEGNIFVDLQWLVAGVILSTLAIVMQLSEYRKLNRKNL